VPQNDQSHIIYVSKGSDILEALTNLTYLICEEADQPERVKHYVSMCEERLEAMRRLLVANNIG
jgi:hypothetical protein